MRWKVEQFCKENENNKGKHSNCRLYRMKYVHIFNENEENFHTKYHMNIEGISNNRGIG